MPLARFRREAEAASRLDHPGICAVYEAGLDGNVPYIAMRFVEGESLAAKIASAKSQGEASTDTSFVHLADVEVPAGSPGRPGTDPSPTPSGPTTRAEIMRIVQLIEKVARALHAAHEAGVLHRDMKPGNVMVTPEGEAVIMDFGLAYLEDEQLPTLTQTGEFFGTPAYMSPEQLLAQRVRLDRRTDVWSLGVMLYECVTLTRPFDAPTREGVYQAIQTRQPLDPRRINRSVPDEIRVVIETALEKDRDRRYQTALDLAEELRRVRVLRADPRQTRRVDPAIPAMGAAESGARHGGRGSLCGADGRTRDCARLSGKIRARSRGRRTSRSARRPPPSPTTTASATSRGCRSSSPRRTSSGPPNPRRSPR